MTLTRRQHECLTVIERYTAAKGYAPLLTDIGAKMGITKVAVLEHVNQLARKGYIARSAGASRGIRVLKPVTEKTCPHCGASLK